MEDVLLNLINKSLNTRYAWKLMRVLFNQYSLDRKEIVNIVYDRALRSRWMKKYRGTTQAELNVYIKQCVITHLRNLLRSEAKLRKRKMCSYENILNKIERGETLDRYIFTESYSEDDTISGTVSEEPVLVSAPSDYNAFVYTPDYETQISILQCAYKHLDEEECQMLIGGFSVEEIASTLCRSVSNLRSRIKKVKELFLVEGLTID